MSNRKLPYEDGSEPDIDPTDLDEDQGADEGDLEGIIEAIASSGRPRPIASDLHDRILQKALGLSDQEVLEVGAAEVEPEPSAFERDRAAALSRALELSRSTSDLETLEGVEHPDVMRLVALARALRLAFAPTSIDALTSERLLRPALAQPSRRANARMLIVATTAIAAIAAAFGGLWMQARPKSAPSAMLEPAHAALPMTKVHSTDELFGLDPFPRQGGASARIDKISASRGAELRNNRFAAWGVE